MPAPAADPTEEEEAVTATPWPGGLIPTAAAARFHGHHPARRRRGGGLAVGGGGGGRDGRDGAVEVEGVVVGLPPLRIVRAASRGDGGGGVGVAVHLSGLP